LQENGVSIWNDWADENGDLGPVYGKQWRHWQTPDGTEIDQLADLIEMIKTNPDSRRLMLTAWNPADVPNMALPAMPLPVSVSGREWAFVLPALSAQRRLFLGRAIQYCFLCTVNAYDRRHLWAEGRVNLCIRLVMRIFMPIISNKPAPSLAANQRRCRKLVIRNIPDQIDGFKFEDFEIVDYVAAPHIAAPIAV
jgi:thymidylate synthase